VFTVEASNQVVKRHGFVRGLFKVDFERDQLVVVSAEDDLLFIWVQAHACDLVVHYIGVQQKEASVITPFVIGRHCHIVFVRFSSLIRNAYRVVFQVDADLA